MTQKPQLVCDNALFDVFIGAGLYQELYDWWSANGLDAGEHYVNEPVTITTDERGRRTIHYTAPLYEPGQPMHGTEKRSAPLKVEPPAHWPTA
ncbi:hypothetical protein ACFY71_36335 [Streptomyces cinerochromogenes]|uniref:hypothetical protein n=1 Tax=Streptomyces cinerochromogenes TaxID=66422 RepID=UPI00368F7904